MGVGEHRGARPHEPYSAGRGSQPKACQREYSSRGTQEAIQELVADFQATVRLVRSHSNVIMLSEAQAIAKQRNLAAMEDWTCRAQKQYGLPKEP